MAGCVYVFACLLYCVNCVIFQEKDEANIAEKKKSTNELAKTESKEVKSKKEPKAKKGRDAIPDVYALDFSNSSTAKNGEKWNMKFASWNVNGIRAWLDVNCVIYLPVVHVL